MFIKESTLYCTVCHLRCLSNKTLVIYILFCNINPAAAPPSNVASIIILFVICFVFPVMNTTATPPPLIISLYLIIAFPAGYPAIARLFMASCATSICISITYCVISSGTLLSSGIVTASLCIRIYICYRIRACAGW